MINNVSDSWFDKWFDSPYYHILYKNRNWTEAAHFIDQLVAKLNVQPFDRILDLACGKGRHAIHLNKKGFNVTGIDLSENSIAHAASFCNKNLNFKVGDMRKNLGADNYEFVFNLFTSFGYFENEEDNVKTLVSIHQSLCDQGVLVIDFLNAEKTIKNLVLQETKIVDKIAFNITRKAGSHIVKDIQFTNEEQTFHFQEKVQAISESHFDEMLEKSGFKISAKYGNYYLDAFDSANSERLIIVAIKN